MFPQIKHCCRYYNQSLVITAAGEKIVSQDINVPIVLCCKPIMILVLLTADKRNLSFLARPIPEVLGEEFILKFNVAKIYTHFKYVVAYDHLIICTFRSSTLYIL